MNTKDKERIYYSRTYRRMQIKYGWNILFLCLTVIPTLIFSCLYMEKIIHFVTDISYKVLSKVIPADRISIGRSQYSVFWEIEYIDLPTSFPAARTIYINLLCCLLLFLIIRILKKTKRPIAVFLTYCMFIHIVNCVFILFFENKFPYKIGDYSDLYLKQQIGIWLMFIVMAGFVFGIWDSSFWKEKIIAFIGIGIYSILFGIIRYILFMFLLYKYSVLYMALMFFVVGPMIDFAYFVMFYASFMNKMIKKYDQGNRRGEWGWS